MRTLFGVALLLLLSSAVQADSAKVRYFVVVRTCADPNGEETPFTAEVRDHFIDALGHRSDVLLERPTWLPVEPTPMKVELARHAMRAYDAHVKVVSIQHKVGPSELDRSKHALTVTLKLQIFGNTLPDRELKIGGSGEATTTVLIADDADAEALTSKLVHKLTRPALDEAIKATIEKIEIVSQRERRP